LFDQKSATFKTVEIIPSVSDASYIGPTISRLD